MVSIQLVIVIIIIKLTKYFILFYPTLDIVFIIFMAFIIIYQQVNIMAHIKEFKKHKF